MFIKIFKFFSQCLTWLALGVVGVYRLGISPFLWQRCRFFPSCSRYAHQALLRFDFFFAMVLIIKRLVKCQPFHEGGLDPVPKCHKPPQ